MPTTSDGNLGGATQPPFDQCEIVSPTAQTSSGAAAQIALRAFSPPPKYTTASRPTQPTPSQCRTVLDPRTIQTSFGPVPEMARIRGVVASPPSGFIVVQA